MELLYAITLAVLTSCGVYLMLRARTFPVVVGLALLSYAVNLYLFATGRLGDAAPAVLGKAEVYADPLPQALVLTAIVISFGMTALVVMIALGAYLSSRSDRIDMDETAAPATGEDA